MGYTTQFEGKIGLNKKLSLDDYNWLVEFAERDHRDEMEVPGYYCQWVPTEDGWSIEWDGNEKFYDYVAWMQWLIENFFALRGYVLNGKLTWQGEKVGDVGTLVVKNNRVKARKLKII